MPSHGCSSADFPSHFLGAEVYLIGRPALAHSTSSRYVTTTALCFGCILCCYKARQISHRRFKKMKAPILMIIKERKYS